MLTTRQAAEYLGLSHNYLRNMRQNQCKYEAPKHTIVFTPTGFTCYYKQSDLDKWTKETVRRTYKRRK